MKKLFSALIFLSLFTVCTAAQKSVYKNQIRDIGGITVSVNGNKPFTGMVKDGKDREFYVNGKPSGKWISFYSNGKLKSIENWKDGNLHGKYILYSENGKKILETSYKKGVDNGKYVIYYPNGKPHILGHIKNGKPNGKWKKYAYNGKLISTSKY